VIRYTLLSGRASESLALLPPVYDFTSGGLVSVIARYWKAHLLRLLATIGVVSVAFSPASAQRTGPGVDLVMGGAVGQGGTYGDRSAFLIGLGVSGPRQTGLLGRMSIAVDMTGKPRGDVCRLTASGGCLQHFPDQRSATIEWRIGQPTLRFARIESFVLAGAAWYDFGSPVEPNVRALIVGAGVRSVIGESHVLAPLLAIRMFVTPNTRAGTLSTVLMSLGLRVRP
jgi:hypothetical protein